MTEEEEYREASRIAFQLGKDYGPHAFEYAARQAENAAEDETISPEVWRKVAAILRPR
jgi:hypothetical protein